MVRALLGGIKTQTRRAAKTSASPYGRAGDRLWVREAWRTIDELDPYTGAQIGEYYVADGRTLRDVPIQYDADLGRVAWPVDGRPGRPRNARFMPRWASRIELVVLDVRLERLQDIGDADAVAEGIGVDASEPEAQLPPQLAYREIWERINGAGSWASNPSVWVVDFRPA